MKNISVKLTAKWTDAVQTILGIVTILLIYRSPQKLQSNFYHNFAYGSYHSILGNKQAACIKINASGLNIQSLFSNILDWHLTNSCHCFIIYFLAFFRLDHFLKYLFYSRVF